MTRLASAVRPDAIIERYHNVGGEGVRRSRRYRGRRARAHEITVVRTHCHSGSVARRVESRHLSPLGVAR